MQHIPAELELSMRFPSYLTEQRVTFETLVLPPAFTSQKRAKYLHVPGRQVAKVVLLAGPSGYLLAVLPATHQVDTGKLAAALGGRVRLASDTEVADTFPDCEWGVVAPFGSQYGLPTMIDETLDSEARLVFEGQTHSEALRLSCRDFERLEHPRRLAFSRPIAIG
jgi:Ala-tRNA(Pro) deacylase